MTSKILVDGAHLVARGALHAGVGLYVGYPITPASGIYAEMIRAGVGISAPDEITALQYLIGASLNGHKVMTATSGPGFLLMAEGIGAALAMETPLVVVLVQRLGPATGSATMNAQGDVLLAPHVVSGGFVVPVISPSCLEECGEMTVHAFNLAEKLRIPVILLTEKDMVVGRRSVDPDALAYPPVEARAQYHGAPEGYRTYGNWDELEVPPFRPLGDPEVQIRATASTHDEAGTLVAFSERVRPNTERLLVSRHLELFPRSHFDPDPGAEELLLTFGFTTYAARAAVRQLRAGGRRISHLTVRTLFPVMVDDLRERLAGVRRLFVAEENLTGQYLKVLLGEDLLRGTSVQEVHGIRTMGRPVTPEQIMGEITKARRQPGPNVKEVRA